MGDKYRILSGQRDTVAILSSMISFKITMEKGEKMRKKLLIGFLAAAGCWTAGALEDSREVIMSPSVKNNALKREP